MSKRFVFFVMFLFGTLCGGQKIDDEIFFETAKQLDNRIVILKVDIISVEKDIDASREKFNALLEKSAHIKIQEVDLLKQRIIYQKQVTMLSCLLTEQEILEEQLALLRVKHSIK